MTVWTEHVTNMVGVDLETTGVDVFEDRIVTASVVTVSPDRAPVVHEWLVNPGVPIPEAATAVHGITDEQASQGCPPAEAIEAIAKALFNVIQFSDQPGTREVPIVLYNAAFDLSMLRVEAKRHGVNWPIDIGPILDPMVIDKHVDRYRRGSRKLTDVAAHYGAQVGTAHQSTGDVLTALRLAWRMAKRCEVDPAWRELAGMTLYDLHEAQVGWYAEQGRSFARYLRTKADHAEGDDRAELLKSADSVSTKWPWRVAP